MKHIALLFVLVLLTALTAVVTGCAGDPYPSSPVYIVVTATPKPHVYITPPSAPKAQTASEVGGAPAGSPAARHIASLLDDGWQLESPAECSAGDCVALYRDCSYLMLYFRPSTGIEEGFGYGVDFADDSCPSGADLSDVQVDALITLGAYDAGDWMVELVERDAMPQPGDERIEEVCGDLYCSIEMDSEYFLMLHVVYP